MKNKNKNKKKSLINRLYSSNIALFIFALFLSFVAWFVVKSGQNITYTINNVPISITVPDGYSYFLSNTTKSSTFDQTDDNQTIEKPLASVDVKGNAYVVSALDPTEINLEGAVEQADSKTIVGKNTVTVTAESNGTSASIGYRVEKINPDTIKDVYIDKKATQSFEIVNKMKVSFENEEDNKNQYVTTTLTPNKKEINVSGPETIVNKIKTVEVHGNITTKETRNVNLSYYDENGDRLDSEDTAYLSPEFDMVTVTPVVLYTQDIPLTVQFTNEPEDIHIKTSAEPNKVRVAGPDEKALQKLADHKIILSIDYSELDNSNNTIEKSITLPVIDGFDYSKEYKIVPGEGEKEAPTIAKIPVDLQSYSAKEITASITKTEDDNYYYVFLPSTKKLKICGSEDELDKIDPKSDITIEPDFSDKLNDMEPGQTVQLQNIPLKITLPKEFTESWVSGKYTVDDVRVTKKYK